MNPAQYLLPPPYIFSNNSHLLLRWARKKPGPSLSSVLLTFRQERDYDSLVAAPKFLAGHEFCVQSATVSPK